jgi:hypothetical protein
VPKFDFDLKTNIMILWTENLIRIWGYGPLEKTGITSNLYRSYFDVSSYPWDISFQNLKFETGLRSHSPHKNQVHFLNSNSRSRYIRSSLEWNQLFLLVLKSCLYSSFSKLYLEYITSNTK